jgi:hypothetical protein
MVEVLSRCAEVTVLAMVGALVALPMIKIPQWAALLIPLIAYPLVYYILAYMPRYMKPINWIFYILAGAVVWKLIDKPMVLSSSNIDSVPTKNKISTVD